MLTLFYVLIVPIVTGMAFLAYHHQKITRLIIYVVAIGTFAVWMYYLGYATGYKNALGDVPINKLPDLIEQSKAAEGSSSIVFGGVFVFLVFFFILSAVFEYYKNAKVVGTKD